MGHIHNDSEYDFTASGMIVHKNKVLLLFHTKLQLWLPPAGHVELNETPIESLYREIEEETGIARADLELITPFTDNLTLQRDKSGRTEPLPFDIEMHTVNAKGHRHIDLCYILVSATDRVTREEDKAEKLEWFAIDVIEQLAPMPKSIHSRAQYALEKAGGL